MSNPLHEEKARSSGKSPATAVTVSLVLCSRLSNLSSFLSPVLSPGRQRTWIALVLPYLNFFVSGHLFAYIPCLVKFPLFSQGWCFCVKAGCFFISF
jgi:Sec-independent protein secretion pathway component TatC